MENLANQISAATAILVFISLISYKTYKNQKINLSDIVIAVIAGGMLPLAMRFTLHSFFPSLIGSIQNMSLQITVTGLVLLYVYTRTIIEKIKSDSS